MHSVVIGTAGNAAAYSVDMLGNLIEGYFVHSLISFLKSFYYYLQKFKKYNGETYVGLHNCRPASVPFCR